MTDETGKLAYRIFIALSLIERSDVSPDLIEKVRHALLGATINDLVDIENCGAFVEDRLDSPHRVGPRTTIRNLMPSGSKCGHEYLNAHGHTSGYEMWDDQDRLLYVGVTSNVWRRFKHHRQNKPWWSDVHRIEVRCWDSRDAALEAEAQAIREQRPLFNVAGR